MRSDGDGFRAFDNSQGDLGAAPGFVDAVDVHKSWHALSILTAPGNPTPEMTEPDPLDPVLGGTAFGEDNGYGEPRFLTPEQVHTIVFDVLARSDDEARARSTPRHGPPLTSIRSDGTRTPKSCGNVTFSRT